MEVQLPKIKTVRVMLAGMTAQQESVFKMAFKMHNTTRYETVSPSDGSAVPDLVLADTDAEGGFELWKELAERYKDIPVAVCSEKVPDSEFPTCPNRFGLKHCFLCSANCCRARMFMGNRLLHPQTGRRKITGMCSVRLRYASLTRIKDYWGRCGLRKRTGRTSLSCMEISRSLLFSPRYNGFC